ncbi:hypothetical protein FIU97_02215 [Roseivivax sp. THAF40]|uniref:hypothetical protein n=1 Tax=Roseivivax sp. THAF40 TaxID=2587858 RepID=UPI001267AC79|nr:hypothetical protein [Roseivivax sp. THAF40]QFT45380.1 hypothetical protein FIU97_02215 [Roseivivax sp. THAF40]
MVIPLLSGIAFAGLIIALMHLSDMSRDRAAGPVMLVAIALFYPVFAVEHGDMADIALHAAIAVAFTTIASTGYRTRFAWVGLGLIGHGLFDAIAHFGLDSPAPDWWSPFCIGVDLVLGCWLFWFRSELFATRKR